MTASSVATNARPSVTKRQASTRPYLQLPPLAVINNHPASVCCHLSTLQVAFVRPRSLSRQPHVRSDFFTSCFHYETARQVAVASGLNPDQTSPSEARILPSRLLLRLQ